MKVAVRVFLVFNSATAETCSLKLIALADTHTTACIRLHMYRPQHSNQAVVAVHLAYSASSL